MNVNQTGSLRTGQATQFKSAHSFCSGKLPWLPRTISSGDLGLFPTPPILSLTFHPFWQPKQQAFCSCSRRPYKHPGHRTELPTLDPWHTSGMMDTLPLAFFFFLAVSRTTPQHFHQTRPRLSEDLSVTLIISNSCADHGAVCSRWVVTGSK